MSEIIVGKYRGRYLTAKDQQFVLLAAPTGADKGTAVVVPNLLNYADSVAVFDLKLENFRYTSLYRQRNGQQVFLWAPFAEDGKTHRWNMLDNIDRDSLFRIGDILAIGQAFYPSDCHPREKFWNDNARNLFLALVLYLMETPELPCTLGEVFRQSSGAGQPLKQHLQDILEQRGDSDRPLSDACVDAINRFLSASAETVGNIISTFNAPLLIFANPIVDAATCASDFDLGAVRRQRMSIFLGIPPNRVNDAGVLANIFFSQLINLNTKQLPENDPTLRHECLLVLDEITAIGKLAIIAKSNAYIRGYRLRLLTTVQSLSQLVSTYGEADARTLITDHTIRIAYPPSEQQDADEYSKMLGYLTLFVTSRGSSRTSTAAGGSSQSEHTSEQARALMLPQELKFMPRNRQIVFARYCRPILCDKALYYHDHRFLDRMKSVSPTLAALDKHGWRGALRRAGLRNAFKVVPTEAAIKHAAFVLHEMSIDIQPISPATLTRRPRPQDTQPRKAKRKNAATPAAPIQLPAFSDPARPSAEEAGAVVDAFFAQLALFDAAGDDATPGSDRVGNNTIESLESNAIEAGDIPPIKIDLSALDN
ncbi:type IV secretory system conjugative DNA transfer family protein [Duganella sp. BJB1802]|uniref:type IV secretory system conjugative DNA transfer family protein n=1 Tax=Duganella sp. BJB1802 TaxID=2744575 RepID=UPI00159440B6|nr:type IV secretory system conjugative DNA transfer family protein [Duganella sp. BJB1802]NVD69585.1 type IV secretory system conjugative DNA transfer family protein [Duganella sp. BJB1802]